MLMLHPARALKIALGGGLLLLSALACNLGVQVSDSDQPAPTRTASGAGGLDFGTPTSGASPSIKSLSVQGCNVAVTGQRYRVQRGDSLTSISKRFGVVLNDLIAANCIDNPNRIRVGQELIIPDGLVGGASDTSLQTYRQEALGFTFDAPQELVLHALRQQRRRRPDRHLPSGRSAQRRQSLDI